MNGPSDTAGIRKMERNKYVLTVITVCYNSEKTIKDTICSVGEQMTEKVEYLIIDGQSSDRTLDIISECRKKYEIHLVSEKDQGIYDAMNKAMRLARGEWLLYINSDDCLKQRILERMLPVLQKERTADCICTDVEMCRKAGNEWYSRIWKAEKVDGRVRLYLPACHQGLYIKKESMEKLNGFDCSFRIAADWDLVYRMYLAGCQFQTIHMQTAEFLEGGASNRRMVWEKHRIRIKNRAGIWIMVGLFWDMKNRLRSELARLLLGDRKEMVAVKKNYIRREDKEL